MRIIVPLSLLIVILPPLACAVVAIVSALIFSWASMVTCPPLPLMEPAAKNPSEVSILPWGLLIVIFPAFPLIEPLNILLVLISPFSAVISIFPPFPVFELVEILKEVVSILPLVLSRVISPPLPSSRGSVEISPVVNISCVAVIIISPLSVVTASETGTSWGSISTTFSSVDISNVFVSKTLTPKLASSPASLTKPSKDKILLSQSVGKVGLSSMGVIAKVSRSKITSPTVAVIFRSCVEDSSPVLTTVPAASCSCPSISKLALLIIAPGSDIVKARVWGLPLSTLALKSPEALNQLSPNPIPLAVVRVKSPGTLICAVSDITIPAGLSINKLPVKPSLSIWIVP